MANDAEYINSAKALIWRIVHRENMPWIVANGLRCRSAPNADPNFVNIGDLEIIERRKSRVVPAAPGGHLSDYVPFYFTPHSPMALNIKTGYRGITKRSQEDIVILVGGLRELHAAGVPFVFSDRHAYATLARYFNNLSDLDKIDWDILQRRDFRRDDNDPEKVERYQAEALIHGSLDVKLLKAIVCYSSKVKEELDVLLAAKGVEIKVIASTKYYI